MYYIRGGTTSLALFLIITPCIIYCTQAERAIVRHKSEESAIIDQSEQE